MTRIFKNLIILSLIVGSIYFVARLAGVADLLDRYVIWVVLVICIHAFYLWGFDHDDTVYMSQSDMLGIKESLPKFESDIKVELQDIREQIVKLKLDIKTQPDPDELKKGIKAELCEIHEELTQLRLHASNDTDPLDAIQGDIKSGLHDIQNKIDEIKSDAISQLELKNDIISVLKTELNNMRDQIQLIQKDTQGQIKMMLILSIPLTPRCWIYTNRSRRPDPGMVQPAYMMKPWVS